MKTLNSKLEKDIFSEFVLSTDEMICVRGGELDPVIKIMVPPIMI